MDENRVKGSLKLFITAAFLIMIVVNALANILPINGQGTGQVSDSYPNLFAPAGLTFAIWGLIYILLALHTLYQIGLFHGSNHTIRAEFLNKIDLIFSISSIANAGWIFAWHYHLIPLSMLIMIIILVCLIMINRMINKEELSLRERIFIRIPFSVYFGWITVATIANATVLLVSAGWNGFGISNQVWAVIIISIGMIIGAITILKNKDIAYGLVLIWAYAGILIKHTSASGFSSRYSEVITTVIVCIAIFVVADIYLLVAKRKN